MEPIDFLENFYGSLFYDLAGRDFRNSPGQWFSHWYSFIWVLF